MKQSEGFAKRTANRRSFLKKGAFGAGAAAVAAGLLPGSLSAFGQTDDDGAPITKGDIAILTFLSALEEVEADLRFLLDRRSLDADDLQYPRTYWDARRLVARLPVE